MILDIICWPDPVLKMKCEPVPEVTDAIRWLLANMEETMRKAKGAGLAAPQVDRPLRAVVVMDPAVGEAFKLVNPRIVELSKERCRVREGCLSLPGYFEMLDRAVWAVAEGLNENGEVVQVRGEGLLGQALQHEIEHLDGIVFVDHLSALKRGMAVKRVKKEMLLRAADPKEYEEEGDRLESERSEASAVS